MQMAGDVERILSQPAADLFWSCSFFQLLPLFRRIHGAEGKLVLDLHVSF